MTTGTLVHDLQITPSVKAALDAAIVSMASRQVVAGSEVVDLLLDIRLIASADELLAAH